MILEIIFEITITDAINIFLRKSIMEGGLPFEVKQPRYNIETETAVREARDIMNGKVEKKRYAFARELFLLVYAIDKGKLILTASRTGTHADSFAK